MTARLRTLKPGMRTLGSSVKEMNTASWRAGKTTGERGYDYRWQKAREAFLRAHPLCEMCRSRDGVVEAASVVDHRVPHRGDQDLFWDQSNWAPLCKRHHDSDKQAEERSGRVRQRIGRDGWPV